MAHCGVLEYENILVSSCSHPLPPPTAAGHANRVLKAPRSSLHPAAPANQPRSGLPSHGATWTEHVKQRSNDVHVTKPQEVHGILLRRYLEPFPRLSYKYFTFRSSRLASQEVVSIEIHPGDAFFGGRWGCVRTGRSMRSCQSKTRLTRLRGENQ